MRLFIAINFSAGTRLRLLALRDELCVRAERGNFSQPENLHLTLIFLGECNDKQTAAIKNAMIATDFEPPDVTIERVGRFKRDGGDIWWAGVRENQQLFDLHSSLTNTLIAAGFTLEKRSYKPHITLGREVVINASPWKIAPFGEAINSVDLMKSERIDGKLTYTIIYVRKFLGCT